MIISAIVACNQNRAIGKGNKMPWYLPADLRYFKATTLGHPIIMGRKTFVSLGRPLPKRRNIVLSRQKKYSAEGIEVFPSLWESLKTLKKEGCEEVFIIGGGQIYRQALPFCHKLYLTEVEIDLQGADTFFPELKAEDWTLLSEEAHEKDQKNLYNYTFKVLEQNNRRSLLKGLAE
ncbi:dihydrofolate reductase [Saprospira grandis]|uniref:dihydrofolate reductase n=1 Tax=Saprospira grandis TaxID=1008 RepID=UPI0022DD7B34|nr:dihydrofolate reductase [Saprospira grandis]WBM73809.1 dihydrofolate reductase [Saprospira grandis]